MELTQTENDLLQVVAELHEVPQGAYNIRKNGESVSRNCTENVLISTNEDNTGIIIRIKKNTKNESVHIPVILSKSGLTESVRNDFYVEDNSEVTIVAGCGIHNNGKSLSMHSGVHRFFVGNNCKINYLEKHFGNGLGKNNEMHPETIIELGENSMFNMETTQIGGISKSNRNTRVKLSEKAVININEKILTEEQQTATTNFIAELNGNDCSAHIVSRAVAKGQSVQEFKSVLNGNSKCFGHTECDCIVMDDAKVFATPEVNALNTEASLIHEAAIGKIAGEQITKLMTLGLNEEEAQQQIIKGFLR